MEHIDFLVKYIKVREYLKKKIDELEPLAFSEFCNGEGIGYEMKKNEHTEYLRFLNNTDSTIKSICEKIGL